MKWGNYCLADIIHIKHGWAFKGEFFSEEPTDDILLTPGNFIIGGGFKAKKLKYYKGEFPVDYILEENDVIVTMTDLSKEADTLGFTAKVPAWFGKRFLHNQRIGLVSLKTNEFDLNYLYWLMRTYSYQKFVANGATGATVKHTSPTKICQYKFIAPENKDTQRKIASILSAYDDLIENNLKRIKLLEEKALMEYRILFSENEINEFPIEDVWEIKYGKNLPQTKITESGKYPVYGAAGRIGFYDEFNYEFPVALVTSRGNGSGVAHRTNMTAFVTNNSFAFVPKEEFVEVHFHLAEMILRDLELTQLRSGTAQPQLTIAGLIGVKLKLPNKEALIEFNKNVDPVFDLIHTLEKQNTKLREARDILLPKLMSGQIEI